VDGSPGNAARLVQRAVGALTPPLRLTFGRDG